MPRPSSRDAPPRRDAHSDRPVAAPPRAEHAARALAALRRVLHMLRLTRPAAGSAAGVTPAQLFVLAQVAGGPRLSMTELAERTSTDRSCVSVIVRRLAAQGLVRRRRPAHDGRRVEVTATPAGRTLLRRAPRAPAHLLLDGVAVLSDAELRALADSLTRVAAAIGPPGDRPAGWRAPGERAGRASAVGIGG